MQSGADVPAQQQERAPGADFHIPPEQRRMVAPSHKDPLRRHIWAPDAYGLSVHNPDRAMGMMYALAWHLSLV